MHVFSHITGVYSRIVRDQVNSKLALNAGIGHLEFSLKGITIDSGPRVDLRAWLR